MASVVEARPGDSKVGEKIFKIECASATLNTATASTSRRETTFSPRKLPLAKAKRYLEDVLAHKQAIPFRRFCRGVGQTAQAKNRHSNGQGCWPAKSASNDEVKGLDVDAARASISTHNSIDPEPPSHAKNQAEDCIEVNLQDQEIIEQIKRKNNGVLRREEREQRKERETEI
ncbi:60S ribosomal protein [Salix suchowensis]|nr:60S ribosomal protein [Salix suchowensis]